MGRRDTGPPPWTVQLVLERDGSRCVVCLGWVGHLERGLGFVLHHRRPRGAGGSRRPCTNWPSNLITLCAKDHELVEKERAWARAEGLLLWQSQDPELEPVHHANGWRILGRDGGWRKVEVPEVSDVA